jgi:hypothetical protein
MFFTDDDGAQAVLFGGEKVVMGNFILPVVNPKFAGILLGDTLEGNIMTPEGETSKTINTKIRICFEKVEHVDKMIESLKKVKKVLAGMEVSRIIKPGDN